MEFILGIDPVMAVDRSVPLENRVSPMGDLVAVLLTAGHCGMESLSVDHGRLGSMNRADGGGWWPEQRGACWLAWVNRLNSRR